MRFGIPHSALRTHNLENEMKRKEISHTEHFPLVMDAMTSRGLLLASYDSSGRANAMTIGWGTIGGVWSMPVFIVLVRHSRYTNACIGQTGCFTVNVPPQRAGRCVYDMRHEVRAPRRQDRPGRSDSRKGPNRQCPGNHRVSHRI